MLEETILSVKTANDVPRYSSTAAVAAWAKGDVIARPLSSWPDVTIISAPRPLLKNLLSLFVLGLGKKENIPGTCMPVTSRLTKSIPGSTRNCRYFISAPLLCCCCSWMYLKDLRDPYYFSVKLERS